MLSRIRTLLPAGALLVGLVAGDAPSAPADESVDEILTAFAELKIEQQLEVVAGIRRVLDQQLLQSGREQVGQFTPRAGVSVNRLLNRGPFEGLTMGRGGGAYFSFTSGANDYDLLPDLSLQNFQLSSGFHGGCTGAVVPLPGRNVDNTSLEDVPAALRECPVREVRQQRVGGCAARVGSTFAVRSVHFDEQIDVIAVVEVLQSDPHGISFAWKILRHSDSDERP